MNACRWVYIFGCGLMLSAAQNGFCAGYVPANVTPPEPVREYRAAWVATVSNIDWPSRKDLTPAQQRTELLDILNCAADLGLNTVIFQVRPGCDAMYPSSLEPWSEYLTGTMGKAPSPAYDPLRFAIDEAHKRGLELHAWFNPYRARHAHAKSAISPEHISKTRPDLVRTYGPSLWLDPGEKDVQDYSLSVVMDVVRRYDVDGVHFDDYFYPYKETTAEGKEMDFPDEASWKKSGMAGKMIRNDWRRQNVNIFIERVYKAIKAEKPWVKFGISPFGIWRPGHPTQIKGLDQYDKLYADARTWLKKGWCDYFSPQLYWAIEAPEQSFPVLLQWWTEQNDKNRLMVPGMNSAHVPGRWKPEQIVRQIEITRSQPGSNGHVHWNMRSLMRGTDFREALRKSVYNHPTLPPQAPWLSNRVPPSPTVVVREEKSSLDLRWSLPATEQPALWLVQYRQSNEWKSRMLPRTTTSLRLDRAPEIIAVSAIDRFGAKSKPYVLRKKS